MNESTRSPEADEAVPHTGRSASSSDALRRSLGTWRLILLVIAAAAPMAAVIGIVPVSFALGNGAGVPLTFLAVTAVLALFAVGYSAMSRRVVSTGAFYSYVAQGLGGVPGLGAACVAVTSYTVFVAGALGYFAYFSQAAVAGLTGWNGSWIWFAAGGLLLIAVLGYRRIDLSSRVIAVLLAAEFVILLLLVVSIIAHIGWRAFPLDSFSFRAAGSGAPGIAVMLAFTCFIGFESAALYSEEAHDPKRSVSRVTYGSVAVIGGFYILTSWVTVGAVGSDHIAGVAAQPDGNLYFDLTTRYLGSWITDVMAVFLATSLFATTLSIHNVAGRYLFSLGRQRCLPRAVGRVHARHGSPHVSSFVVTVVTTVILIACVVSGVPPLVGLGTVAIGFGTVGVITLQCLASLAIVGYFRKIGEKVSWTTTAAPLLAFVGLGGAVLLAVSKFELLSGTRSAFVNSLPVLTVATFLIGGGYALWLRSRRPVLYRQMTELMTSEAPE
ncbi:APC family permease [Streptomyces chartreusis]|uniref:APC family permease n=1 Tax=Streptomyces chartreusis TaxID=1969 RepID=A0A7H8T0X5_STRCX|nr:APC family permease [Streptomyces chartreusis]QKZ17159.1 APC family permease [Streptomyces chartreusis]